MAGDHEWANLRVGCDVEGDIGVEQYEGLHYPQLDIISTCGGALRAAH
jgi:hypothetical protein